MYQLKEKQLPLACKTAAALAGVSVLMVQYSGTMSSASGGESTVMQYLVNKLQLVLPVDAK